MSTLVEKVNSVRPGVRYSYVNTCIICIAFCWLCWLWVDFSHAKTFVVASFIKQVEFAYGKEHEVITY